ncbi:MAG: GGDEF domain-containing protein [Vicinamibacteria bacterium]|nr:GGDEF domain-containing protein [Vicinamibacteria bacterium]
MPISPADRERIAASRLFRGVDVDAVPGLWDPARLRTAAEGALLLSPERENHEVCVLLAGRVEVRVGVEGQAPPRVLAPGDCFGEVSLIDGRPPSATVTASTPVRVFALDEALVWALVETQPAFSRNLLYVLCGRTRTENAALTESQRARADAEQKASLDALTGVRNRRWMDAAFRRQLERSAFGGEPVSLLMFDLDDFKGFNDHHGHAAGDAALRTAARVFDACLRPGDLLARYGGEEFVALLPGANLKSAVEAAERLRQAVEREPLVDVDGRALPSITVSIGAAPVSPRESLEVALERADRALYRAKDAGRNRVCT